MLPILRRVMKGFVLSSVVGSVRQLLSIIIAVLAVAGAVYLGSHKLSNPDHYRYGGCFSQNFINHGWPLQCSPPTRAAWQIPVAILIGTVGLGAAAVVGGERRRRRVEAFYDNGDAFRIASR